MSKSKKFAVADCETLPFKKHRLIPGAYVWEFWDGETRFVTYDTKEFVDYISEFDGIIYAHNGGKFDWHFLLEYLEPYDNIMLINGRIAKASLGKCDLRDSYNIIPVPLAAYKKDTFDYSLLEESERTKPKNAKKILKYLHSDCVNLFELVERFIADYGLHLTIAGAAMKQWVKLSEKEAPTTSKQFYEDFSPFYYGGRVECFESGVIEDKFSKYDINSAYPFAMLEAHPYSDNYTTVDGYQKGADFFIVECVSRGAFPYRDRGLTFPNDSIKRTFYVTKWEYDAAIDTKTLSDVRVIKSIKFIDSTDFSVYVNHFMGLRWECKANNDDAGSLFAKMFAMNLYGKFAANPENYHNHMIIPLEVAGGLDGTGWSFGGEFGPWGLAIQPLDEHRQRFYNVATGASITGYARAMLWRGICGATRPVYCDTDAITCAAAGEGIVVGEALGQWKHEGEFDKLGIGGKKLYIMRGAKGWWKDENGKTIQAKEKPTGGTRLYATAAKGAKLTENQLWRVARGETVTYESEAPTFSAKKAQSQITRKIRNTACIT